VRQTLRANCFSYIEVTFVMLVCVILEIFMYYIAFYLYKNVV
jgi:hypothetical protein